MRLRTPEAINCFSPCNYGHAESSAAAFRQRRTVRSAIAALLALISMVPVPAKAQQASPQGFDPRQTEKRFDDLESQQTTPTARSGLQVPRIAQSGGQGDHTPLFVLRK